MDQPKFCKPNPRSTKYNKDLSISGYYNCLNNIDLSDEGLKLHDY